MDWIPDWMAFARTGMTPWQVRGPLEARPRAPFDLELSGPGWIRKGLVMVRVHREQPGTFTASTLEWFRGKVLMQKPLPAEGQHPGQSLLRWVPLPQGDARSTRVVGTQLQADLRPSEGVALPPSFQFVGVRILAKGPRRHALRIGPLEAGFYVFEVIRENRVAYLPCLVGGCKAAL